MKKRPFNAVNGNISIADTSLSELIHFVDHKITAREKTTMCFMDSNLVQVLRNNSGFENVLNSMDLILPDGVSVQKIFEYGEGTQIQRIPGPDFMLEACQFGLERNWGHYFIGGFNGVAGELATSIQQRYEGIKVSGFFEPDFIDINNMGADVEVINKINKSNPEILWVGLGGPKQEYWIKKNIDKLNVPLVVGVGAAFDFHSNKKRRAPQVFRKFGMEWAYRSFTEGRRIFLRNIKCCMLIGIFLARLRIKKLFRNY